MHTTHYWLVETDVERGCVRTSGLASSPEDNGLDRYNKEWRWVWERRTGYGYLGSCAYLCNV